MYFKPTTTVMTHGETDSNLILLIQMSDEYPLSTVYLQLIKYLA